MSKNEQKVQLRLNLMKIIREQVRNGSLPSERDLASELGVTRYLLRGCLKELSKENILQRKGSRQSMRMLELHPWTHRIGVVVYDGQHSPCIDDSGIFFGIIRFFRNHPDFLPQILNFNDLNDLFLQMKQYELDGCIWMISHESFLRDFHHAVGDDCFRFVFAGISFVPELRHNQVCVNLEIPLRNMIGRLVSRGAEKIAYVSNSTRNLEQIRSELQELNIPWDDSMHIGNACDADERIPLLVREHGVNALFCDGSLGVYPHVLKAVAGLAKAERPFLASINNWRFRKALVETPALKGETFLCENYEDCRDKIGYAAGEMLLNALKTGKLQENRLEFIPELKEITYSELIP